MNTTHYVYCENPDTLESQYERDFTSLQAASLYARFLTNEGYNTYLVDAATDKWIDKDLWLTADTE